MLLTPLEAARRHARSVAVRVTLAVAALAAIATSQPSWTIEAPLPSAPPGAKALLATVEASAPPQVIMKQPGKVLPVWPEPPFQAPGAAWPGRAEYLIPPGFSLQQVSLSDKCVSGGGLCSKCEQPPGAFVRVASLVAVEPWEITATSPTDHVTLTPKASRAEYLITVKASRRPEIEVIPSPSMPNVGAYVTDNGGTPPPREWAYRLHVYATESLRADATLHFHLKATVRGHCASAPCPVPDGEAVSFVSIAPRDKP